MEKPVFPQEVEIGEEAIVILWDDGHRSPYPTPFPETAVPLRQLRRRNER